MDEERIIHSFIFSFIQSINQHGIKGSIKEQQRPLWDKEKAKKPQMLQEEADCKTDWDLIMNFNLAS